MESQSSVRGMPLLPSGSRNAVVLERTDAPSTSSQIESQIQSVPPGGALRQTQAHLHSSTVEQVESDESDYEDAQDVLPSAADTMDPMSSDYRCTKASGDIECFLCGESGSVFCDKCTYCFCSSCDILYHKHKSRQDHKRRKVVKVNIPAK